MLKPFGLAISLWQEYLIANTGMLDSVFFDGFEELLIAEAISALVMILISIYLIYLFFTKHRKFPTIFIMVIIIQLVFYLSDNIAISVIMPGTNFWEIENLIKLATGIIISFVFIAYILKSRRVRNTFVNH